MKKLLIFILVCLSSVLVGCDNQVVPNENEITLKLEQEFIEYMNYETIPSFTFTFDGTLNTIEHVRKSHYTIFAMNDDFKLSEEISKLFTQYANSLETVVVEVVEQPYTRINERDETGKATQLLLVPDEGKIYLEVAFIALENGLKLTLDYRRFSVGGETYYAWRYQSNISMTLYYPLMVISENNTKEIVILTLPNRIKYAVGPNLVASKVISNDSYLEDIKYTFNYLDELETVAAKKQHVINYYINEMNGSYVGENIHFEYLGVKFAVVLNDNNFLLRYVEKVS